MSLDYYPRNKDRSNFNLNVFQYTVIGEVMKYIGECAPLRSQEPSHNVLDRIGKSILSKFGEMAYPPFHASEDDCKRFISKLSRIRFKDRLDIIRSVPSLKDQNVLDQLIYEWIKFLSNCGGYDVPD